LRSPPGRYLLAWEQALLDAAVADLFGFHALQLGLPELDGLRANRMPQRWCARLSTGITAPTDSLEAAKVPLDMAMLPTPGGLICTPECLPFPDQSLDLVVMPHTLESAADPHQALAEVCRVLRPEGRVVIIGLNPASLWGLRQHVGHFRQQVLGGEAPLFLPNTGEFLGYWRLRDWLKLLNFEIGPGQFGCYRPPLSSPRWLERMAWMERTGDRWWPVLGAVYAISAVKRVRGMRLVGLARREAPAPRVGKAAVANRTTRQNKHT